MNRLKLQLEGAAGDIDLLLTCEWPEGILLATPPGSTPEGLNSPGDKTCKLVTATEICIACKGNLTLPSYLFTHVSHRMYVGVTWLVFVCMCQELLHAEMTAASLGLRFALLLSACHGPHHTWLVACSACSLFAISIVA